jgi:hypothetical protein
MEQNVELKTFGLRTPRHHVTTIRLRIPWHYEMKDPWTLYPWAP